MGGYEISVSRITGAILLLGFLGFAVPAFPQGGDVPVLERNSSLLSGFFGLQIFDLDEQLADFGSEIQGEVNLGGRYQYNFTPRFGVEGNFLFSPSGNEFIGPADPENIPEEQLEEITDPDQIDTNVDAFYYNVNGVWNILPHKRVIPFVTGGIGAVSLDVEGASNTTKLAWNFGGGVLFAITERLLARVEARDYIYTFDDPDSDVQSLLGLPPTFEETIQDLSITGGISFIL